MSTTIVTVTLNPAIDQTLVVDHMLVGEANRVIENRTDPGGKGINVSRVLRELGAGSVATGFAPGGMGRFIEHELERLGILVDFVHTRGETRTNLTLIDARLRTTTTIHAQGPLTDSRYVEMFRARVRKYLRPGTWLVVAGSIPPPLSPTLYTSLIAEANAAGAATVLDAADESLRCGVKAKPTFLHVNRSEFEGLIGEDLSDEARLVAAAESLQRQGVRYVLVTRSQHPSIAVDDDGAWRATPPPIAEVVSPVGAGDAALAAAVQVLAEGGPFAQALRHSMAAGSACTLTPGTQLCDRATVMELEPRVQVERIHSHTHAPA